MGECDNLASEVHRAARRRGFNQHGIEDRPIEPPARLLGVEYELVARKPRISPCRHGAIGRAMPRGDESVPNPEMDEDGSDRAVRAAALFDRLCRLDPWQALRWDE